MIELDIHMRRGSFQLDVTVNLDSLGVTALLGPSGCGKSTLASIIAGLTDIGTGRICVNSCVFDDTSKGIHLTSQMRGIGFLFQSHRLFPHLNVQDNLFFGRTICHRPYAVDPEQLIQTLGIGHLLSRRPSELSGGESQRVALGRAILAAQNLLILDEPLSSLDSSRRQELLGYLENVLQLTRIPVLYITHAQEEADRLAHCVLHMRDGQIDRCDREHQSLFQKSNIQVDHIQTCDKHWMEA